MSITLTAAATAAAQFLEVLDSGEALSSQQLADALLVANNLLESWWEAQVLAINVQLAAFTLAAGTYTPATTPQFADTTTPITIPSGWVRALKLGLAIEISSQYAVAPSQALLQQFSEAINVVTPVPARVPKGGA